MAFDMRLFYAKDLIAADEVVVRCCPTNFMVADCASSPCIGEKFNLFRDYIMNLSEKYHSKIGQQ